jgi:GT2 family glycosyltransferase
MKPTIFVIIPVFNRFKFTKKCLTSIFKQKYKNYKVILIDDGSIDGTKNYIRSNFPEVKIIKGDGNWWWTKCMYEGTKYALKTAKSHDYVLEMNNDLYFDSNYFDELIKTSRKHKNSLIGSICVRAVKPTEVVEAGVRIDWPSGLVYGVAQTISNKLSYYKNMEVIDNIDALPGKGTLIPVDVFNKGINFKYKQFPHYIADYEFAINAKNHGYNLLVSTTAIAKHYWEATGISSKDNNEKRSYQRAINLLLGRRSMNNIVDWIKFIHISCPPEYKLRNYYYSFLKIVRALFTVFPFYYLLPVLPFLAKCYHITRLLIYRLYLKVIQFPKYHLNKN